MKLYKPIQAAKTGAIKAAKLDKVPGSNLMHVMKALPLQIISTSQQLNEQFTLEKLKTIIKVDLNNEKEPVKIVGNTADQIKMAECLAEWMVNAAEAVTGIDDIWDKISAIPDKVTDVVKNVGSELEGLDMMALAKVVNEARKKGNEIKKGVEDMKNSMTALKTDVKDLKAGAEELTNYNQVLGLGNVCFQKKKFTIKDCYESIYEPIKAPPKVKNTGANGCCVTF